MSHVVHTTVSKAFDVYLASPLSGEALKTFAAVDEDVVVQFKNIASNGDANLLTALRWRRRRVSLRRRFSHLRCLHGEAR